MTRSGPTRYGVSACVRVCIYVVFTKLSVACSGFPLVWHGVPLNLRYEGGRFVMRKKSIQAKELNRMAREQIALRIVCGEGDKKGR